mgnify:FL=1
MPACLDSQYQASQNTPGTLCYIIGLSHPSLNSAKHMKDTWPLLKSTNFPPVSRRAIEVLQVNLGYLCNQSCLHCHVAAGPNRKELMTEDSIDDLLHILKQPSVHTLDLTGGAPEMYPFFTHFVLKTRVLSSKVLDRFNLTILHDTVLTVSV